MTSLSSAPFRRRFAAAGAVLGLVAASVVGGVALSASAAATDVTLSGGDTRYVEYTDTTFEGTLTDVDNGSYEVDVAFDGSVVCTAVLEYYSYEGAEGSWSCNASTTFDYGSHTVVATVYDPADTARTSPLLATPAQTVIVYENAVGTVNSQSTSRSYPQFSGTGPRMGTVTVEADDGTPLCSSTLGATSTSWQCTSTVAFTVDDYQVWPHTVLANEDDLGRGTPANLEVGAPGQPTLELMKPEDDLTSWEFVNVEGTFTSSPEVSRVDVTVSVNGGPEQPYCSVTDGFEGTVWQCFDPAGLGIGTNVLRAYAIGGDGVFTSPASSPITVTRIAAPVITSPASEFTNTTTVTFSGTFPEYARFPDGFHFTFFRSVGDSSPEVLCEGDADTAAVSCAAIVPSDIEQYWLHIETDDVHYFESDLTDLTFDDTAPTPPVITGPGTIGSNGVREYSGTLTSISGTGEPYATVTALVDGSPVACGNAPVIVERVELGDGFYEGRWTCTLASPATPGTHTYSAFQTDEALNDSAPSSASDSLRATIPVPPPGVLGAQNRTVQQGGTFTLGGTKTPEASVVVTLIVPGGPNVRFAPCNQIANGDKAAWQCNYSTSGLGLAPGTYQLSIVQVYNGETSPELTPRPTLTITAVTTPTPTPTATKPPLTWTLVMTGVSGPLKPGQWVGLSSSGLPAGSEISAELHSTPIALGSTTVRSDGTFNFRVQIPMNVEPGDHHIVVTLTAPGEDPSIVQSAVQIELDGKATPPRDGEDIHAAFAVPGGAVIDRNNPDSPTAITGSIPTAFDILTSPGTIGIAAGLALVILLLVALPTEILNATIESNTSRFGRVFAAIQSAIDRATEWFIRVTRTPLVASVILLVVTSFIFGFVDPGFGFDLASVRLVLSLALALFVITFVASSLTGRVIRKRWSLESEIGMQPAALIFALLGVLVARLLDFSPGFLVGLVIGLELAHRATEHQRVRAIVVEFSFIVGFGVLAWLAYSAWIGLQGDAELGFVGGLVQDALVAITSEGLTAVTVAMIPIAFLDGKKIFESSKKLWVVMFLVVATAFSTLVLPTALAGQEITNIVTWVAVLIGFAVVTLGLTVWLRRTGRSVSADANEKVSA